MIGFVPEEFMPAFEKALSEGRLSWRCTDAQGRPSNGGEAWPIEIGQWSETIDDVEICRSGWHTTSEPWKWFGARVFLVEGEGFGGKEGTKMVWRKIRPLAEVDPRNAIDARVALAACRTSMWFPYLRGADLSGADLSGANLRLANLNGANLMSAYLRSADLIGAHLRSANLYGACLDGAYLHGAHLRDANLSYANLSYADLNGADLRGADLSYAYLRGANLDGANLEGAIMPVGWKQ